MTTSPAAVEELLRDTLDRLPRQERRTAALEAVLLDAPPTVLALPPHPLTQTPTARAAETTVSPRPKRDSADDRAPRPKPEPAPVVAAVSPLAVLASLDDVVWSVSPDGQLVFFAGGAVERLYGVTANELHDGRGRWLDALPADDRDRLRAALARLPDADAFTLEHRIGHAAGGDRWAVSRGKLVRDRDGRPLRVDGTTTDVTRRARTRAAVLDVLEGVGSATGGDFLTKLVQHLCSACDCRAAVVAEPHPHEVGEGRSAAAWIDGRSAEPFAFPATAGLVRELLAGGRALVPADARDRYPADPLLLKLRADAFAAEPLTDDAGRALGFVAVADDRPFAADADVRAVLKALAPRAAVELARVHERGALEARLAAAEARAGAAEAVLRGAVNLATAGRMAAGVAHDFNNLLGVIAGNAELIREALPPGDRHREMVETIARAAYTVAGVSRKLLAVGTPGPPQVVPLDAGGALRALEPILRRLVGNPVRLAFDLAPGLPVIRADATQFDRVVLNLVLNARDATGTGTITVRAAAAAVEPGRAGWPADRAPGPYVAITVSDTGCGMSPDVRAKMFETFFTTKGDRGTGLGLATVREAVTAAGGHVEVESEVGWGTQVRVYWPPLTEHRAGANG